MSVWGQLDARFLGPYARVGEDDLPRGSEGGPNVHRKPGEVWVEGNLRDVSDEVTSPLILAWFIKCAAYSAKCAELMWTVDGGPRYRYRITPEQGLAKLKGVLDL